LELHQYGFKKLRSEPHGFDLSSGTESRRQVGPRFDPISHDWVFAAAKAIATLDPDRFASLTFDLRPHFTKRSGQVDDLGLTRAILEDRFALRENRGHHDVFGRANAWKIEEHARALKPFGFRDHVASFDRDLGTQFFEAREMEIDGARANCAAARKAHLRTS